MRYPDSWPQAPDNAALERVYQALYTHGSKWESGQDFMCVAHDDRRASLGVTEGDDQPVVFRCQAGCTTQSILTALEMRWGDIMLNKSGARQSATGSGRRREPRSSAVSPGEVKSVRAANRSKPAPPASDHTLQSHLLNDTPLSVRKWTYTDAAGAKTVVVRRRDYDCADHPKAIDQLKVPGGVAPKLAPYELYRLKDVRVAAAGNRRVMVVAGEPSVDAAIAAGWEERQSGRAGWTVTTMRGGEKPGAWLDAYSESLVGARSVLVVADRDLTGYRHALEVADSLKAHSIPVRVMVSKTERPHDDIVDHLAAGFTAAELVPATKAWLKTEVLHLEQEKAQGKKAAPDLNVWPMNPRGVARKFLDDFEHLRNWRGDYYTHVGSHWRLIPLEEIERALENALHGAACLKENGEPTTWPLTTARVKDVMHFVERLAYAPKLKDPPFMLDGSQLAHGSTAIPMKNGVLELDGRTLTEHSSELFNVTALPFPYRRRAPQPERWLSFLKTLWGEDTDSVKLLQEVMGYLVSGRTDFQKIALIVGPPRSGKGTIAQVCQALLGKENVAWPTLDSLATQFGLAPLIGKTAAIVADARFGGRNGQAVVERLLTISGEDSLTIDRKMRDAWTGKVGSRFFIMSNESPSLRENSGALANRMLHLRLTQSFLGKEDHTLGADLLAPDSLAGIFNWALDGLDRLLEFGWFTVPRASAAAERELVRLSSPVTAFVQDECVLEPNATVTKDTLYESWVEYADESGTYKTPREVFGRDLIAAFPALIRASQSRTVSRDGRRDPLKGNARVTVYRGVRLKKGRDR